MGATSIADPALATRLFQRDGKGNPQLSYLTRLFGAREIALGVVTLAARGKARRRVALTGVAVDGADAAAGILALQDGSISNRTAALVTAPAVLAALTGLKVITHREPRTVQP